MTRQTPTWLILACCAGIYFGTILIGQVFGWLTALGVF